MKKTLLGVLSAAVVVSLCVATAFAAGPGGGRWFVDADGDGICDNAGSRCAYVDADGDGICDTCGASHPLSGSGRYFVDENGDGLCDNYGRGHGHGGQCGLRAGRGR